MEITIYSLLWVIISPTSCEVAPQSQQAPAALIGLMTAGSGRARSFVGVLAFKVLAFFLGVWVFLAVLKSFTGFSFRARTV